MAAKKAAPKITIVGFIRQYLASHPEASNGEVVEAGAKAGLKFDNQKVSQTKSDDRKKGLKTGIIRKGRPAKTPAAKAPAAKAAKAPAAKAAKAPSNGNIKAEIEAIDRELSALQARRKKLVDEIVELAKWAAKA